MFQHDSYHHLFCVLYTFTLFLLVTRKQRYQSIQIILVKNCITVKYCHLILIMIIIIFNIFIFQIELGHGPPL